MAKFEADQFIETLAATRVKRIYGIVGDSLNGLTDAVRRHGIHVRQEEVAAFAAGAEAHLTDKLAVCAGRASRSKSPAFSPRATRAEDVRHRPYGSAPGVLSAHHDWTGQTNNVLALAFGVLIVTLVIGGSLWIMANLNENMTPSAELINLHMQR